MPNEVFDIRLFNKGIASNFDLTDTPLEAAQWSENVDSQAEGGVLRGVKTDQVVASPFVITNGTILDKTINDTLKKILVYTDGTTVKGNDGILNNTANTLTTQSLTTSNASSFTPQNNICYIGTGNNTPVWAGYYKSGLQFNGLIHWNGFAVNDLEIDTSEVLVSNSKTITVAIVKSGSYNLSNIVGVGLTLNPTYSVDNSNHLPFVGDTVVFSATYLRTATLVFHSDNSIETVSSTITITNSSRTVATRDSINLTFTLTGTDFPLSGSVANNPTYETFHINTWSSVDNTASFFYKDPNSESTEIIGYTDDNSAPVYSGINNRTKYLIVNDRWSIDHNIKITLIKEGSHAASSWYFIINPTSDFFLIEGDMSIDTPLLANIFSITTIAFETGGSFLLNKQLIYAFSLIYDYVTESPIFSDSKYRFNCGINNANHRIKIDIKSGLFSTYKRVTGINLYFGVGLNGVSLPSGYYRLLKSFNIAPNEEFSVGLIDTTLTTYELLNTNQIKGSYEANSGISQEIDTFEVKYSYSTKINNHLFVAKCFHADLPNAERMIFRSKPFQLHKFDWVNEYLTLDFVPVSISNFQGKLFVFGTYKMAKINPEQFYIEEQIEGIGCLNDKMVVTTDAGMFWGDANYAYMWDGQKINKISLTISEKKVITTDIANYSWKSFITNSSDLQCVASPKNRTILFINKALRNAFVWDIEYQRWDFKLLPDQTFNGVLTIPDGNILLSTSVFSGGPIL